MKVLSILLLAQLINSLTACSSDSIKIEVSITNRSSVVIDSLKEYNVLHRSISLYPGGKAVHQ